MVLLNLNPEGNKSATIEKPDIQLLVFDAISKKYNEKTAKRYSKLVADFLKDNMAFTDDGIYKLEGSQFFVFDLKTKKWKKTGKGKADYVITPTSDFWVKYDSAFPFLKTFRHEIETIIYTETGKMFDQEPTEVRYIEVRNDQIICHQAEDIALSGVFRDYMAEDAIADYVNNLLMFVFNTPEYPVFVIYKGKMHACITSEKVKSQGKMAALKAYLEESFLPEDAKQIYIRVRNILTFGKDMAHYLITELDAEGRPIYEFCGLKVVKYGSLEMTHQMKLTVLGILLTQENADVLFKKLCELSQEDKKILKEDDHLSWHIGDGIYEIMLDLYYYPEDHKSICVESNNLTYDLAKFANGQYKQVPMKYYKPEYITAQIPTETVRFLEKVAPTAIPVEIAHSS